MAKVKRITWAIKYFLLIIQQVLKIRNFVIQTKPETVAQKLVQTQTQSLGQTLTPQQLLQVHLLELPLRDFEQRVKDEILDNSALEEGNDEDQRDNDAPEGEDMGDEDNNESENAHDDALADYLTADDTPDYLLNTANGEEEKNSALPFGQQQSLYEELTAQISEHNLTDEQKRVMVYLIGSLDSDGFLRKDSQRLSDEMAIYHNIEVTPEEIDSLIATMQTFEPHGIGARGLQECLMLQVSAEDYSSPYKEQEKQVLGKCYEDFIRKRWDKIASRLHIDRQTMEHVLAEIRRLNPRPGSALNEANAAGSQEITPDFRVENDGNGNLIVSLNEGEVPSLRISNSFRATIAEYSKNRSKLTRQQKDTYTYTKQKVESAKVFIDAVNRRRRNMLATMEAITEIQKPFFMEGDETMLRPMILRDVAQRTGLDISTVSRVSNSKYVETEFGVFPLKYFFNDKFVTTSGDVHSTMAIRKALSDIIGSEDKNNPYPDEVLAEMLKQKGFPVARRTVAKYRMQLGLPVARLRK